MKPRTLSAAALILLAPLVVLALQAQADQFRKRDYDTPQNSDS
jgi:defensin-like protein